MGKSCYKKWNLKREDDYLLTNQFRSFWPILTILTLIAFYVGWGKTVISAADNEGDLQDYVQETIKLQ